MFCVPKLKDAGVSVVDLRAFGLRSDSDGLWGAVGKRMTRRTRRTSCRGGRASVAAVTAPSVREASHDGASTGGAAAAPTAARERQEAIYGWPSMSAQTLRRPICQNEGWGPANWSVHRGSGGRRHGRLELAVNVSILFFSCDTIYIRIILQQSNWVCR